MDISDLVRDDAGPPIIPYWLRLWSDWREWRYLYRRIVGYFVRGWRGWADHDTWGLDGYIAGVLAGSLRHLASTKRGCPQDFVERAGGDVDAGCDLWVAWLREKADWFEWYCLDEDGTSDDRGWIAPGMSDEEKRRRIDVHRAKLDQFFDVVLPDFGRHFGSLWD